MSIQNIHVFFRLLLFASGENVQGNLDMASSSLRAAVD